MYGGKEEAGMTVLSHAKLLSGPKTHIFSGDNTHSFNGANLHTFLFSEFISPGGGRCDKRKIAGL